MSGGVVAAGEDTKDSAVRELGEELGIYGVPIKFLFDFKYQDDVTKVWCWPFGVLCEFPPGEAGLYPTDCMGCRCGDPVFCAITMVPSHLRYIPFYVC